MYTKFSTLAAATVMLGSMLGSAPAVADHGDCVYNSASDKYFTVPEMAGSNVDVYGQTGVGGVQIAASNPNSPLSTPTLGPCSEDTAKRSVFLIPNANANPNALGAPNGAPHDAP